MPVLEAMACGLPVVCTLTVSTFAKHGVNALIAPPLELSLLSHYLVTLLGDTSVANALSINARATAQMYTWENAIDRLELALVSLADTAPVMEQSR